MAPRKAIDKGKAPMVEEERMPMGPVTRSRGNGIMIREATESERRPRGRPRTIPSEERMVHDDTERVDEPMAQEVPTQEAPEGSTPEIPRVNTEQPEVAVEGVGVAGPSKMAAPVVMDAMAQPQLIDIMQMMMGALHDMRQDMRHFMEIRSQPHASTDAIPSPVVGAHAPASAPQRVNDEEVETMARRPHREEIRRTMQEERADMRAFQEMHPPAYQGEMDYKIADKWVSKMEKIFEYLQCTEEQRVRFATFMLEGDAEEWWKSERETFPGRGRGLSWAEFLDLFLRHYIPTSERIRRAAEFSSLVQGKMSVIEYDIQFRSLSRFVAWTRLDAVERARKFQEGLRPSIRAKLAAFAMNDYAEILDRARRVEREEEEWAKAIDRKRSADYGRRGGFQGRRQRPRLGQGQQQQRGQGQQRRLGCFSCGQVGHRVAECPHKDVTCFECGQRGHKREHCPRLQAGGGQVRGAPPKTQQHPLLRAPVAGRGGQRGRPHQYQQQQPRLEQRP